MNDANNSRMNADVGQEQMPRRTVIFYSPDVDLCVSMRMLFQDRYHVVTVSDPAMVMSAAREFHPYLMIVDSAPTKTMLDRFEVLKREFPQIHIMSLYAPHFSRNQISRSGFRWVDAAFPKPIDLAEVTHSMSEMLSKTG